MTPDLIRRYAVPVPRYTSYPTANHFSATVTDRDYRAWLADLPRNVALSLYVHIPYCRELCWYCGCNTKAARRYKPVDEYLVPLLAEIDTISALVPPGHRITHLHWGGGSPDILSPADILRLGHALSERFSIAPEAEFAVEIDPRILTEEQADSFAEVGLNRVSIGVQDFDIKVQRAIGRIQSVEGTRKAVDLFRARGIESINMDLVYGLPHQTADSASQTLAQVLELAPDRIAIFGYAHLPDKLKHQRMIDEGALPGPVERFEQSQRLARELVEAGYAQLGLDHFARPGDGLMIRQLKRNFQGYTTDQADCLLGFGASSISHLPQGFVQNVVAVDEYARRIKDGGLATARGHEMRGDDAMRAYFIERLMCDLTVSWLDLTRRFGGRALGLRYEAEGVIGRDKDAFVEGDNEGFWLTERGRPFVRTICAQFDPYLLQNAERRRHALSV